MKYFFKINENGKAVLGRGNKIPDGFTEYTKGQEPKELLDALLIDLKKAKKQEIESAYQKAIQEPIQYTVNSNTYTFQADKKSQDILSQIIAVAPTNFETDWFDIDNNPIHVTLDDLKACAGLILNRGQEMFAKKVALKKQLEQCDNKECLEQIKWD